MPPYSAVKIRDRAIAVGYTLLIYISLPVMPGLWRSFSGRVGQPSDHVAFIGLGLLALLMAGYLIFQRKPPASFIRLLILIAVSAWGLSRLKLPIERIHFIEYGLLSVLVFRAFRHNIKCRLIYLWSGLTVFGLGWIDEGIQYLLPSRAYDTRDVVVNGAAGVLGLLIIGLVFKPKLEY